MVVHTPDALLVLHRRLLAGDEIAGEILFGLLYDSLKRRMRERDPDNRHDAVVAALFDVIKYPEKFDPAKGKLEAFLLRAARCNLSNLRRSDYRRRVRDTAGAQLQKNNVELRAEAGNFIVETQNGSDAVHQRLLAVLDPADRPVAELLRCGEKRTAVFAETLGLTALPIDEQRLAVKRAKDRVNKARLRLKG